MMGEKLPFYNTYRHGINSRESGDCRSLNDIGADPGIDRAGATYAAAGASIGPVQRMLPLGRRTNRCNVCHHWTVERLGMPYVLDVAVSWHFRRVLPRIHENDPG